MLMQVLVRACFAWHRPKPEDCLAVPAIAAVAAQSLIEKLELPLDGERAWPIAVQAAFGFPVAPWQRDLPFSGVPILIHPSDK